MGYGASRGGIGERAWVGFGFGPAGKGGSRLPDTGSMTSGRYTYDSSGLMMLPNPARRCSTQDPFADTDEARFEATN